MTTQTTGETHDDPGEAAGNHEEDGVVAIATLGPDGPHMVNTWNGYLRISQDGRLFIPAGYMHKTEANITHNPNILITLGSSKVEGLHGEGAGFLIKGKAIFVTSGPDFDFMKKSSVGYVPPWPLQSNQPLRLGEAQRDCMVLQSM